VTVLSPRGLVSLAMLSLLLSGLLAAVLLPRERAARAEAEAAREQARAAAAEREAALARMKALEAQVEPHFLYNTLAHVTSLIDEDPRAARTMLDRLVGLLRATAGAGASPSTLGAQADLVRDWLGILALRMGARLAWHVDVPPHLRDARVPPALLQPLVENAVKHGLEPKVDGGRVDVVARDDGGELVVVVTDTGAGFGRSATPLGGSTGLGLAGLKARLAALYDGHASVALAETPEGGVRATIRLPLERSP
jgi:sensor histidine kinase YesM